MQLYQPLAIIAPFDRPTARLPAQTYWDKFRQVTILDYKVPACSVMSRNELQRIAVVTARQTDLYCGRQQKVTHHIPSGKEQSTCGAIRSDGKLIAIGKKGSICLHELQEKTMLRKFVMKQGATATAFSCSQSTLLLAGNSRDLVTFDIAIEQPLQVVRNIHTDLIKRVADLDSLVLTASYDGTMKLVDPRMGEAVLSCVVGAAVEDVLVISGKTIASLSQGHCKVWDIANCAGPLLDKKLSQKTLTSLELFDENQLVIGSVDHHLRVWDWKSDKLMLQKKLEQPITHLSLTNDRKHLAVGMGNGRVTFDSMLPAEQNIEDPDQLKFEIPVLETVVKNDSYFKRGGKEMPSSYDLMVKKNRLKMTAYDRLLRKFRFGEALALAASKHDVTAFVAVFQDIEQKGQLPRTTNSLSDEQASSLTKFIADKLGNPECDEHILTLLERMLQSKRDWACLGELSGALQVQKQIRRELAMMGGTIDLLLSE